LPQRRSALAQTPGNTLTLAAISMNKLFISIIFWLILSACSDSNQLCGIWKLEKLMLPEITYDLTDQHLTKMNFLKLRPKNLSADDSIAYERSFDDNIQQMAEMYLVLNNDSSYKTNAVLESKKLHTGTFSFNAKTKVLSLCADSNSFSTSFRVISLNNKELVLSEFTSSDNCTATFKKQD
jgi:hypothetical protein